MTKRNIQTVPGFNPLIAEGFQNFATRSVGLQLITGNLIDYINDVGYFNSATAITSTLPLIASYPAFPLWVKNIGAGTVTLGGNGANIVGGTNTSAASTYILYTGDAILICSDGTQWQVTGIGSNLTDINSIQNTVITLPVYGSEGIFPKGTLGTNLSLTGTSNVVPTATTQIAEVTQAITAQDINTPLRTVRDSAGNYLQRVTVLGANAYNETGTVKSATATIIADDLRAFLPVVGSAGNINCTSIAAGLNGQELTIIGTSDTDTYTLTSSTTNVKLNGGTSFTLGLGDVIKLIYTTIGSLNKWCEVSRSNNT